MKEDVERRVVDDEIRAINEARNCSATSANLGLSARKAASRPWISNAGVVDVALRVDVELQAIAGEATIYQLDRAHLDHPMALLRL